MKNPNYPKLTTNELAKLLIADALNNLLEFSNEKVADMGFELTEKEWSEFNRHLTKHAGSIYASKGLGKIEDKAYSTKEG